MCDCRQKLNEKFSELYKTDAQIIDYDMVSGKTHSRVRYTDTREKKPKENIVHMLHTNCPFCGKKYE